MFRIPDFYQEPVPFQEAWNIMTRHGRGSCLKGMEQVVEQWNRHCASHSTFENDDDFFDNWKYEVNAFNVVFTSMKPLFTSQ